MKKLLLVGIEKIDNQHIQVCDFFKSILKAKEKNNEEELMGNVKKLIKHWKIHFKYEEDLMEQYKYSGFYEHKKEHDRIMNDYLNCEEMYSKGFKYIMSCLALNLNLWIEEHIKHTKGKDQNLAIYLKSKGVT